MTRRLRMKPFLKSSEVAELLRVEACTVRLWNRSGKLRGTTTIGGHRRFEYRDVEVFAREHGIELANPQRGTLRVLVVDDDKRMARAIKTMLVTADPDIELEVSHDGFTAGQMVEKFQPHLMILDLIMPGVDGFQLCKGLKADPATKGIRIVAISGDTNPSTSAKIVKLGAELLLPKPIVKADLLAAVGLQTANS